MHQWHCAALPPGGGVARILGTISDTVSNFLYYDRKSSARLPATAIPDALAAGEVTVDDMVAQFRAKLIEGLKTS